MFIDQRGVSMMFAVLIMSFILSIALGISIVLIRQVKVMREAGYSVVAFYAANSGIEEILFLFNPDGIPETALNGATYEVSVNASTTPGCNAPNWCITSTGSYKDTRRAIEIRY